MYQDFHQVYSQLVEAIMMRGMEEVNERTGAKIRMMGCPMSLIIDMQAGRMPVPGNRRVYPGTAAAEVAWMLSGEKSTEWLRNYCRIWDKFVEPGTDEVANAYGYMWRHHFGRDQIQAAIDALKRDPTDRQVWISAWDPGQDGMWEPSAPTNHLGEPQLHPRVRPKNVACPVGFAVNITRGNLNLAVFIRSSDVFVGLPYDVMGYALLLDAFAVELDRGAGFLHVTLAHPHIYEAHFEDALTGMGNGIWAEKPEMPGFSVAQICEAPDLYVATAKEAAGQVRWPEFNPRPEVIE